MCKLLAIVEIENPDKAELFVKKAIPIVTKTDNHGLGIMRLGENGVHIQRWLEPPAVVSKRKSAVLMRYEKVLKHQSNETGTRSRELYAIAVHGRFATCAKSLQNTHPFYKDGTALMHNGIISNAEKFTRTLSTCDSEALLSQYIEHGVKETNLRLTEALTGVQGYYAAIVFNDNGVIDIWRDDHATLFLAHVRGVGVVIATTKEIILGAAKKVGASVAGIDEVLPYSTMRWTKGINPQFGEFEAVTPYVAPDRGINVVSSDVKQWWKSYDGEEPDWRTPSGNDYDADYSGLPMTDEEKADLRELRRLQGAKDIEKGAI